MEKSQRDRWVKKKIDGDGVESELPGVSAITMHPDFSSRKGDKY